MKNAIIFLFVLTFSAVSFAQSNFSDLEGDIISLRSVNYPDRLIRHQGYVGKITTVSSLLEKKDASFRVVRALNGQSGYVSLESVNFPGYYLRHQGFVLKLHKKESSQLYKDDSSFKAVAGLSGQGYSFESANFPNHFLRHSGFKMQLAKRANSDLYKKDASFTVEPGHYGTMVCTNSRSGGKVTFLSKNGQTIKLRVDWDEGATFSSMNLDITNGTCVTCPRVGGIGRPHGKEATYEIKQTNPSQQVILKWGGNAGNIRFCGEDQQMVIDK